ncbi:MAG: helix-turn-helix domain-containing protein [Myxococcota bacterium]|nr:helix-turn-helix domain-containing protein [Myxococcota bacterium]
MKPVRPENDNSDLVTLDIDPATIVKTIAAGICLAGMRLIEQRHGRPQPPLARDGSDVMIADEVAEFLRLDRKTVYDYATRGVIPHQRIGKRMLFSRLALVSWLGASLESCSKRSSNGDSA